MAQFFPRRLRDLFDVLIASPSDGQVLTWENASSLWKPKPAAGPSGAAGGDLAGTYPNPTLSTARVQAVRVNAGAFTVSQTRDVAITWPVPFADANYTPVICIEDVAGTANNSAARQIQGAHTASGLTVRIAAGTVGYSSGQLFINAIGIHD